NPYWIEFDNPTSTPRVYRSPPSLRASGGVNDDRRAWDEYYSEHALELRIHGTVVWVVGHGARFNQTVRVVPFGPLDPANPNVLVLVAKPNGNDPGNPNSALWFEAGLDVDPSTSKVFLVSEADVNFTQDFNSNASLTAGALT